MTTPAPTSAGGQRQGNALGSIHPDTPAVLLAEQVLDEVLEYSEQDMSRERGGFLLGQHRPGNRPLIEISHFLSAKGTRSRAASLTFTHDTWAALHDEMARQFPNQTVLGWQHTHPGMGVFLSAYDVFLHRHFFAEPWQVAMVVDPRREEFGFFQWRQGDIVDCGIVII